MLGPAEAGGQGGAAVCEWAATVGVVVGGRGPCRRPMQGRRCQRPLRVGVCPGSRRGSPPSPPRGSSSALPPRLRPVAAAPTYLFRWVGAASRLPRLACHRPRVVADGASWMGLRPAARRAARRSYSPQVIRYAKHAVCAAQAGPAGPRTYACRWQPQACPSRRCRCRACRRRFPAGQPAARRRVVIRAACLPVLPL